MALIGELPKSGFAGDYGIQNVWDEGIRGRGVKVGVNDSGLIRGHADFDYAGVDGSGYLLNDGDRPLLHGNQHGTAVAGIIGARADGIGVVGVAHEAELWTANCYQIAFVNNAINAGCDIVNNSWQPTSKQVLDRFGYREHSAREFKNAARGRNGLGMSLVFSAGHSRSWDTSVQSTTNHENVIAVAAVDINTRIIDWSTPGDAVHVSALGRGNLMANANDLTGRSLRIHDGSDYAAPIVSGVVALMYQANPGLGLRDVQSILAHSARLPQSGLTGFKSNGGEHANGGGLAFSRDYGFGLVDAHQAVRLAKSWFAGGAAPRSGMNRRYTEIRNHRRIDEYGRNVELKFVCADAREVEHVKLFLELDVSNFSDMNVVLVSPQGTTSVLMDNFGAEGRAFNSVIDLGSRRFWGENAAGEWTVKISSRRASYELGRPVLLLSGSQETPDDRYVYTDSFNLLAASEARRLVLEDKDGGADTFNASCLSSDAVIDLRAANFRVGDGPLGRITPETVIEHVIAGDGNDCLVGNEQVDSTLDGGGGDDTLKGGLGLDTLIGGPGNDAYMIDNHAALIVESPGEGEDTVISSAHYRLAEHVEHLELTGTAVIVGIGNALNNRIKGNAADNILDGGDGDDTLSGGAGNDTYYVGCGDVVIEAPNAGIDSVFSDRNWMLHPNVENLSLTGQGFSAVGNGLDNLLKGNAADNSLDGGEGVDTLIGGPGDDIYYVGGTGDVVIEEADAGNDTLISDVDVVLGPHLEKLVLSDAGALRATGNALDNVITGNAADNLLEGGGGSDTLVGGRGNDHYTVDNSSTVVREKEGEGIDMITSSITLTLPENVEILVMDDLALWGRGNALDNLVRGNDNTNVLEARAGSDILEGRGGDDYLHNSFGTGLCNGGTGRDIIIGGDGTEVLLGGPNRDTLESGAGDDIILFNAGDGQDALDTGAKGRKTLSLGGNFAYSDLRFSKSGTHLVLKMGSADQISFRDWYAATPSRSLINLQVIAEAMNGFQAGGDDPLRDQKVERFDFTGLVGAFDAACAASATSADAPTVTEWALSDALSGFLRNGSDEAALGGDLAYQYGRHGTLVGIGLSAAQTLLSDRALGAQAQPLRTAADSGEGLLRLS